MRHQPSAAWLDLGYGEPAREQAASVAALARVQEQPTPPVSRAAGQGWFRLMHQAVDGVIYCSESGRIEEIQS